MEINITTVDKIKVVAVSGDIDASTAPTAQQEILPVAQESEPILLDLTEVEYMSSAGLRVLLSVYRQVTAKDIPFVLVGLSEELQDTMSVTGFLDFFTICETQEAGLDQLTTLVSC
ncbi:MAG: anti-sigma factor antagonist [Cyanobacteria bacterium P01_D01_bin.1]